MAIVLSRQLSKNCWFCSSRPFDVMNWTSNNNVFQDCNACVWMFICLTFIAHLFDPNTYLSRYALTAPTSPNTTDVIWKLGLSQVVSSLSVTLHPLIKILNVSISPLRGCDCRPPLLNVHRAWSWQMYRVRKRNIFWIVDNEREGPKRSFRG